MTGTVDESVVTVSVLHAVARRLPWLLVGLGGGLVSALVISRYEVNIRELVGLAFFVPVITAMGGNVAIQSSSIAVRALAMGEGAYRVMGRRILKEFLASLLNGLVCGAFLGFIAGVWLDAEWMAMLLGAALFAVIIVGTTVGAVVPVVLNRLRVDPALATGPFVTTTNDVLGIVVYLALASWLLPRFR
jgi:magnesium transporter